MLRDLPAKRRCRLRGSLMWRSLPSPAADRFVASRPVSDLFPVRRRASRRSPGRRGRDQEQRLKMGSEELRAARFSALLGARVSQPGETASRRRTQSSTTGPLTPACFEALVSFVVSEKKFLSISYSLIKERNSVSNNNR